MRASGELDSSAKGSRDPDRALRPATQPSSDDIASSAHLSRHAREREIARVLARHGIRLLGHTLASERPGAPKHDDVIPEGRADIAKAARELRLALEELGPTFIKLGQLLSTRADLLPLEYRRELTRLQDAAPPSPPEAIRKTLESELTGGIAGAFADFDLEPLAAGSVGEAHAAVLHDGTQVVVKVRRPGVVELIERDLAIIVNLAARASRRSASAAAFDALGLAQEFAGELRAQLDYVREACNAERFGVNFAAERTARIPRVFWELTTSRVITLERLGGMKVTDRDSLDAAGLDRGSLARNAALVTAKMVFVDGLFHGDPHPGNFFVEADGTLGIIDFGIVGSLDEGLRAKLGRILFALERRDPKRLASAMIALRGQGAPIDRAALEGDLAPLIDSYVGLSVAELGVGGLIRQLLEVVRRYRLRIPRDMALLLRTILLEEGVVEELDPQFRLLEVLAPYARQHLFAGVTRAALLRRLQDAGVDFAELLSDLPDHAHRLLSALEDGGFEVHLRAAELEPIMARAERLGNRIAISVVLAAVIDAVAQFAGRAGHGGRRRARASSLR
jgi:ubiquinone biosynthesis protein